jgi:hypothetical protein
MPTNTESAEKRIAVDYLKFGKKTAKRVAWESWEFTVVRSHQVRVTNASYGFKKEDHAYVVGVEVRDGLAVPAECECPADKYGEDYDCKHKVALATVGGPTVLNAGVEYKPPVKETPSELETMADKLKADGGTTETMTDAELETCPNGNPLCDGPDNDTIPCFACFEGGSR